MSSINDGGPAFPVSGPNGDHPGMSLRDWFAGQAMAAMVASYRMTTHGTDPDLSSPDREMMLDKNHVTGQYDGANEIASDAYIIADVMLAAREVRQ